MAVALIVAAGRGERLGSDRPKALVALAGRPMLAWSVDALRAVPAVREIVVALPAQWQHAAPEGVIAVAGGEQRSHSVRAALRASSGHDPVIVHDAARPLVTPALFLAALAELEGSGAQAAVAAAPVTDTIKEAAGDRHTVTRTLDRSRLWAIQTPQVFRRDALQAALDGSDALLARATDDAWLIEQAGGTVRIVPSGPGNFKVTTPQDLRVAELLIADRDRAATGSPVADHHHGAATGPGEEPSP
ncbi:MAG TPA: 2-C-methyl-D-erythritol 4-phosphate cytidylyltransferase [Solirubrobacteraceae bacterium]|nr:2-C-methyl-D-erythritol 4-phosphate cytidylyltransferase [Solirubrobacteraceae bacterium]